jgi:putative DNA primase/helicase
MNLEELKQQRRWVGYKSPTDKAPMNPHTGRNASSTDSATWATYAEATAAQARYRWHGVGFVLNGDGIVGIDLDDCLKPVDDGYQRSNLARHIMAIAPSYTEVSPSGTGLHIIGMGSIERAIKATIGGDAVEVYSTGRYLTYTDEWVDTTPKDIADISDAINEIMDMVEAERDSAMMKPAPVPATSSDDEHLRYVWETWRGRIDRIMQSATEGNRHNSRIKAGRLMGGALAALRQHGYNPMSDDHATQYIYDLLIPDQGEQRIEYRAIEDGVRYGLTQPLTVWERRRKVETTVPTVVADTPTIQKDPSAYYHLTDIGNGLRLVDSCVGRLCYVAEWKQWLVWDGQRWCKGDDAGVMKLAHKVALGIYDGISKEDDEKKRKELLKWAIQSESAVRIDAMIKTARPYLTIPSAQFDTRPDMLCVRNGVVNLRTGQLIPHDATMMLTKRTDIDYDPTATAPTWRAFLDRIFEGNGDVLQFIQRAVGYTLTGSTDEHCLFFLYGVGANGKSTFLEAMRMLMGEYYVTTSVEAMLATEYTGGATPYVASLPGMRMAMASEMPEGRRFNESLIKDITGGGTITARHLYGAPFEFQPSHTMWISGNYRPRITGTDEGIWRRLKVVPFNAFIPPEQRRPMAEVLDGFRNELSGILTWAVQGAVAWYDWGLPTSPTIEQATMEYRGEEDVVARFVAAVCVLQPDAMTAKHKVFEAWQQWTDEESEKSANGWSQRRFTEQLKRKGVELGGMGRMFYVGIGFRSDRTESG